MTQLTILQYSWPVIKLGLFIVSILFFWEPVKACFKNAITDKNVRKALPIILMTEKQWITLAAFPAAYLIFIFILLGFLTRWGKGTGHFIDRKEKR